MLVLPPEEAGASALLSPIGDRMPIERVIDALEGVPEVSAVVVARRRTTPGSLSAAIRHLPARKTRLFAAAGGSRLEGIALALEIAPPAGRVLVHDANRALVSSSALASMLAESLGHRAAAAAVPVKNTYKEILNGRVRRTLPREELFQLQGTWIFDRSALEQALAEARRRRFTDPDERALCQRSRISIRLVEGSYPNVPIGAPEDLEFAQLVLTRP